MHSLSSIAQKYFAFDNELNFQTKENVFFLFTSSKRDVYVGLLL